MPLSLPFLPDAPAGGTPLKYMRAADRAGAAHYYTIAGRPQAAVWAFCKRASVSSMTRSAVLCDAPAVVCGWLAGSVSKKLTNNFLTFALFGASLIFVLWNRDVNDRFLFICHAIG
jgi:hypothetical protein